MSKSKKPKQTAHIFEAKWRSDDVKLPEAADFSSLLLSEKVLLGLKNAGFRYPSPIQVEAIPVGRFGNDVIVQAKSGTGKTLVFTIIALDIIKPELKQPQVLIVAPTREIAFQICDVVKSIGSEIKNLKCGVFIGGFPIENDLLNIQGCQVIVGTPGRLKQLFQLKILKANSVHLLVLDEADQLMDSSFKDCMDCIFKALPPNKQVIATSATYPKSLAKLVDVYFKPNPCFARLSEKNPALLGIAHFTSIFEDSQMPVLAYKRKVKALEDILTRVKFSQCLVFCNAVSRVEALCNDIKAFGFSATYISSAKDQTARLKAIDCLKHFKCKVLVSSDVTSRGIDAENVDLIINVDVPYTTEIYLHRVGRAGRYGTKGVAITLVAVTDINSFAKIQKEGKFKSYKLPDPVPEKLIDWKPPKNSYNKIPKKRNKACEKISLSEDMNNSNCINDSNGIENKTSSDSGSKDSVLNGNIIKDTSVSSSEESSSEESSSEETVEDVSADPSFISEDTAIDQSTSFEYTSPNQSTSYEEASCAHVTSSEDMSVNLSAISEDTSFDQTASFEYTSGNQITSNEDTSVEHISSYEDLSVTKSMIFQDTSISSIDTSVNETSSKDTSADLSISSCDASSTNTVVAVDVWNENVSDEKNKRSHNKRSKKNKSLATTVSSLKQICLDNVEVKNGDMHNPVVSDKKMKKPNCADDLTAHVMGFIDKQDKKNINKPQNITETLDISSKKVNLQNQPHLKRSNLSDYYHDVFQAFKNDLVTGNGTEQIDPVTAEKVDCAVPEQEEKFADGEKDAKFVDQSHGLFCHGNSTSNNSSWTDVSDESLPEEAIPVKVIESTPKTKANKGELVVYSNTPPFLNIVDSLDTVGSSDSNYSNKCLQIENACRNKSDAINKKTISNQRQICKRQRYDTSDTDSSTESETSSYSESDAEIARRKRVEAVTKKVYIETENRVNVNKNTESTDSDTSSSESESTSSSETDSLSSDDPENITLLEKGFKEMMKNKDKPQSLAKQAVELKQALNKIQNGNDKESDDSSSGIQITTAAAYTSLVVHESDDSINDYPVPRCKTRRGEYESSPESEESITLENNSSRKESSKFSKNATCSSRSGRSSGAHSGKFQPAIQLLKKDSSDDSEESDSSGSANESDSSESDVESGSMCSGRQRSRVNKNTQYSPTDYFSGAEHNSFNHVRASGYTNSFRQNVAHGPRQVPRSMPSANSRFNHQIRPQHPAHPLPEHNSIPRTQFNYLGHTQQTVNSASDHNLMPQQQWHPSYFNHPGHCQNAQHMNGWPNQGHSSLHQPGHGVHGFPICQATSGADWDDFCYRQWYWIQHGSYLQ